MNALITSNGNSLLGQGAAQGAANKGNLRKMWQDERINGTTSLQFTEWLVQKGYRPSGLKSQ